MFVLRMLLLQVQGLAVEGMPRHIVVDGTFEQSGE